MNYERPEYQCPNCGAVATFTEHSHDWKEKHGLDCGPYEACHQEWLTCDDCDAETTWEEVCTQTGDGK